MNMEQKPLKQIFTQNELTLLSGMVSKFASQSAVLPSKLLYKLYDAIEAARDNVKPNFYKEDWCSISETMELLGIGRTCLWRWTKDGYLHPRRFANRTMYSFSEIESIMDEQFTGEE